MKSILLLTLLFILSSCKEDKKELVEIKQISSEFILEFLNEILADTSESRYFKNEVQLISNYAPMIRDFDYIHNDLEGKKFSSLIDYKADILNTKDTTFIKNQLENKHNFNLNHLSKYGYKIFDLKKCFDDGIGLLSIDRKIESENVKNGFEINSPLLMIEKPTFNKDLNLAYVRIKIGDDGKKILFKKKNSKWKFFKEISTWNEGY